MIALNVFYLFPYLLNLFLSLGASEIKIYKWWGEGKLDLM